MLPMSVEIRPVESRKDLKRYVQFPLDLYKDNEFYVPTIFRNEMDTLDHHKNPAFRTAEAKSWLAWKNNRIAGRITGIHLKKYAEIWKREIVRFDWVDFIDDSEVSRQLFSTMEEWAVSQGAEAVSGPQGFTDFDPEGMLIEGFDELGTLPMLYNYPYYPKHLESMGYTKHADWVEFEIACPKSIPEKVARVQHMVLERNKFHLLEPKKSKDLIPYGHQIFDILGKAYKDIYGYIPLTKEQIDFCIKQYIGITDIRYSRVAVDDNDRVVATSIIMPSLSRALQKCRGKLFPLGWYFLMKAMKKPTRLDFYLIAVDPKYQSSGVLAVIMGETTRTGMENGIKYAETSGELETNTKVQNMWRSYEHRQHKRRRCYIKELRRTDSP